MASATSEIPDLTGRRIFIASGRLDPWTPPAEAERMVKLFTGAGAEVEHLTADAGHQLTQEDLVAARQWFAGSRDS